MTYSNKNELDPNLRDLLETYDKATPQRDPTAEKRTRDRFMTELDAVFEAAPTSKLAPRSLRSILMVWASGLNQLKENLAMLFLQRSTMSVVATVFVLIAFLFGGGGITAYAASGSIPGDALYPVKTSLEDARINLAGNDEARARLFLDFAGRRLDEIKSLIADNRFNRVSETVAQFENAIEKAREAIRSLAQTDPGRAASLDADAAKILKGYDDALNTMLTNLPADIQPAIQGAMNASEATTSALENGNVNDNNSNLNVNTNDDQAINDNNNANVNDDHGIDANDNENVNDDKGIDNNNNNINDDHSIDDNSNTNINDDNINTNTNNTDTNTNSGKDNSNTKKNHGGGDNTNSGSNDSGNDNSSSGGDD